MVLTSEFKILKKKKIYIHTVNDFFEKYKILIIIQGWE
jgi:hypothetical protein